MVQLLIPCDQSHHVMFLVSVEEDIEMHTPAPSTANPNIDNIGESPFDMEAYLKS